MNKGDKIHLKDEAALAITGIGFKAKRVVMQTIVRAGIERPVIAEEDSKGKPE